MSHKSGPVTSDSEDYIRLSDTILCVLCRQTKVALEDNTSTDFNLTKFHKENYQAFSREILQPIIERYAKETGNIDVLVDQNLIRLTQEGRTMCPSMGIVLV